MANYNLDILENLTLSEDKTIHNAMYTPYYGSIALADSYFQYKLYSDPWNEATEIQKKSALVEASRAIDRLLFWGCKTSESQKQEFPRNNQTIPDNINFACFEIALKLLDGYDPDTERDNTSTTSRGFGQVRVNYDRGFVPLHLTHGIASSTAWNLLQPYLADANEVLLRRG